MNISKKATYLLLGLIFPSFLLFGQSNEIEFLTAATKGETELMSKYLDQGVSINTTNKKKETALMLAASNNHLEAVELLLTKEADLFMADKKGKKVLQKTERAKIKLILADAIAKKIDTPAAYYRFIYNFGSMDESLADAANARYEELMKPEQQKVFDTDSLLNTYEINELKENDFRRSKWNVNDPYLGKLGFVSFARTNKTTVYTLGYFPKFLFDNADNLSNIILSSQIIKRKRALINLLNSDGNVLVNLQESQIQYREVCQLYFENGKLVKIVDPSQLISQRISAN